MTEPAIRAERLTKHYGATVALDALDLTVESGEVYGYLGPNGAGKTTTIRLLLGLHRASAGRAELFGRDSWSDAVAAHRRVAYVAGEPTLWPGLTGAETLAYLGNLHGSTDAAYRDELVERFKLDAPKTVRALSNGNRQKVQLIAALAPRRPADPRRADDRPGPVDGAGVPRGRPRGEAARPDRLPLLAHPQRGRGALRPGGDPAGGSAGR